jgi:hypothetical protein
MWMMTQNAFTSTVFKQVDEGWFMMRFRDVDSADKVCEMAGIDKDRVYADLPSDYPLRLKISEDEMVDYFRAELKQLTYRNFKDQAKKTKGPAYANALMKVWSAMFSLTPNSLKNANHKAWDEYDRKHKLGAYRPKAPTTVRYSSGQHPSVSGSGASAGTDGDKYSDNWWYRNYGAMSDVDRHMDEDSDFTDLLEDDEADDLVDDIDAWLDGRSIHDLTEAEWLKYLDLTDE